MLKKYQHIYNIGSEFPYVYWLYRMGLIGTLKSMGATEQLMEDLKDVNIMAYVLSLRNGNDR